MPSSPSESMGVKRLLAAVVGAMWCCSSPSLQPASTDMLSVSQLNSNKDQYVGATVSVEGRIHVLTVSGLKPCPAGQPCPKYDDALLTLADSGTSAFIVPEDKLLRLYRRPSAGTAAEPIHCRIVDENVPAFDCGAFTADRVSTVSGVFTRAQEAVQTVVGPDGQPKVLKYQDTYYLLID